MRGAPQPTAVEIGLSGPGGTRARSATTGAERAAFAALLILYLALSLLVFDQIEEDAFIYFRLVGNLVHGDGLVFNRGGLPIEAGSSPLWMLLLWLSWKAPWDIVVSAKLLGLAAGGVCLWLVWRISRLHLDDPLLRLGPPLLTVGSTPFLMWSQRGLETPLFTLIVLWLALCCVDAKGFRWWPLPGALLLWTRPEGCLFLLALLPVLGCDRGRWRTALPGIAVVAAAAFALLTARLLYFHDLVPSAFYIKLHGGGQGLARIREYLHHSRLFVFVLPLVLVAWKPGFWIRRRIVLAGFIAIAALWCALANDYMPYVRPLVAVIPLLQVLLVDALNTLLAGVGRARRALGLSYVGLAFVVMLFFSRSSGDFGASGENAVRAHLRAWSANPVAYARQVAAAFRSPASASPLDRIGGRTDTLCNYQTLVGDFLRRNYPADSVVVYDQMGQTPYYAGWRMCFIDSWGLTDRTIGRFYFEGWKRESVLLRLYDALAARVVGLAFGERRAPVTQAQVLDYIFGRQPDLILLNAVAIQADAAGIPASLRHDPRLAQAYALRYTLAGAVAVYERRGVRHAQRLEIPAGLAVVGH